MAVVSGRLQIRNWTDKEGNKRRSAEVVADNVYFGDSKRDAAGDNGGYSARAVLWLQRTGCACCGAAPTATAHPLPRRPASDFSMIEDDDSQLPF